MPITLRDAELPAGHTEGVTWRPEEDSKFGISFYLIELCENLVYSVLISLLLPLCCPLIVRLMPRCQAHIQFELCACIACLGLYLDLLIC